MDNDRIHALCRPGFEADAGQELMTKAAQCGCYGYFVPFPQTGWVQFHIPDSGGAAALMDRLPWRDLVFVRDWFAGLAEVSPLPPTDRVGAVLEALAQAAPESSFSRVEVHVPDGESVSRDVHQFARKWVAPLSRALRGAGWLQDSASRRLDLMLCDFDQVVIGWSHPDNRSPFLSGRPRLKFPASAPSRSTLKLEEAWKLFIPAESWLDYLGGGRTAVDLGAAPGGWTWQLVNQGMNVMAVDNGPMDEALLASGHVEHIRADAFVWRPKRAVDWMVCDIVDKPARVTELVAGWLSDRLCKYSVFNLKLPMKQRWENWEQCRERLEARLQEAGLRYHLAARQLYHDREEITVFVMRLDHG